MGCLFSIVSSVAGLVLGVVIFVGFLSFLILNNFSDKLLSADFYKNTIAAEDSYNRIYDEVLVDDELREKTAEILGDIKVVNHQEIVDLLREIIPPAYIQQEIEASINRTVDYINEDVDVLEAYVDLTVPLENVQPVMFAYLDRKIDELNVLNTGTIRCSLDALSDPKLSELSDQFLDQFVSISDGEVPTSVPSLELLEPLCRQILFRGFFDQLLSSADFNAETTNAIRAGRDELKVPFEAGETLEMLKVASHILTGPLIDVAIEEVRNTLSAGDRFDLIHQLGEWDDITTEAQIRSDIADGRDLIAKARDFGDRTSLIMVIGGAILLGLVFFPTLSGMLRWPGLVLFVTGLIFFVVGKIAESEVPDRLTEVIETGADKVSDVPPSVTDLGGDILISFGSQLTDGFVGPSLTLLILGAILFGSSFFTIVIKRFIPFVK